MLTLLEEKQKSLEQNLQAVKLEQQMLKVLCKDSTSVYRVDLMNDRAEIVKIEEHSNSAGDLLPHGQELFSYAEAVEHYYHKCVLKESAPDFLQFLDAENLMRELRTKDRVSRRYQSVPNAIGNIYFEVRANRVQQTETSFQILLDFRSVDEIVREEREHQHALETALTESRMSYEVISAISKIYYTIYRIDLRTGYSEEAASERQMHRAAMCPVRAATLPMRTASSPAAVKRKRKRRSGCPLQWSWQSLRWYPAWWCMASAL